MKLLNKYGPTFFCDEEYINNIEKQVVNLKRERDNFGKNCKLFEKELLDRDERNDEFQNNIDNIITELKMKHKKELLDLEQKNIQLKIDFYDIIRELKSKYEK